MRYGDVENNPRSTGGVGREWREEDPIPLKVETEKLQDPIGQFQTLHPWIEMMCFFLFEWIQCGERVEKESPNLNEKDVHPSTGDFLQSRCKTTFHPPLRTRHECT